MKYITGIHALNLDCSLDTCGDWHQSAIQWENPNFAESKDMFFKDWGIEPDHKIPEHDETFYVANHIRALLDLLEIGNYAVPQGMNADFICNEKYDNLVFLKIADMQALPNWKEIDAFITKEYKTKWIEYKRKNKDDFIIMANQT